MYNPIMDFKKIFFFLFILYLILILAGTMLLCLPDMNQAGERTPWIDAIFTAISAVTGTGMVIFDTYSYWTMGGQLILLFLILSGSLLVIYLVLRWCCQGEAVRRDIHFCRGKPPAYMRRIRWFVYYCLAIMFGGGILLYCRFLPLLGEQKSVYFALFHSISAFCNAGFDLMGYFAPFSSFYVFRYELALPFLISILSFAGLLAGGCMTRASAEFALRFQANMIFHGTLWIIAVCLWLYWERDAGYWYDLSLRYRCFLAAFQIMGAKASGFHFVDFRLLSIGAISLSMLLMLIGGSFASTAGGLQSNTLLAFGILFYRKIKNPIGLKNWFCLWNVKVLYGLSAAYLGGLLLGICLLFFCGGVMSLAEASFTALSALGNVGLWWCGGNGMNGLTKIVLMALMLWGKINGLLLTTMILSPMFRSQRMYG